MVHPHDDPVALVDSRTEEWRDLFGAERERVRAVAAARGLDDDLRRIDHVGSTAVPGLAAKDVVDLDVVVDDGAVGPLSRALVAELGGDRFVNDPGWQPVFRRGGGQRFNLHVFGRGSDGWKVSVVTRDVLRSDPALRREYEHLKRSLAAEHDEIPAYSTGKTDFVRRALEAARVDDDLVYEFEVPTLE
jgi:GrpB-like predicted nucleotidyltransferase (UPF0157 family)